MIRLYPLPIPNEYNFKKFIFSLTVSLLVALQVLAQPGITAISPSSGPAGTIVTITGSNFGAVAADNIVNLGGVKATVTAATSNSLTVQVPAGAVSQPFTVTVNGRTAVSKQVFNVTFQNGGNIAANSFEPYKGYEPGGYPQYVVVSDIDGDGKPDIASINNSIYNKYLSVLRNTSTTGAVSFAQLMIVANKAEPTGLAAGDIDGDGKPDLVVAYSTKVVTIYRNTSTSGNVSFEAKDFTIASVPRGVAIGDMDADGLPDLAVGTDANTVAVFQNTGTIGSMAMAAPVSFAVGAGPKSITVADVDGDEHPDVITANATANTISVLRSNGTAGVVSFEASRDFAVQSKPACVAAGDLDGDGKPDLAVANTGSSSVSVLQNTTINGQVAFAARQDYAGASSPNGVCIGDLNGDGKPDLAVAAGQSDLLLAQNTSSGTALSFGPYIANLSGGTKWITTGDIDVDGKPDVIATNYNYAVVLRNRSDQPVINAFSPRVAGYGQAVGIKGSQLTNASAVSFGGTLADSFRVVTADSIIAYVATGSSGNVSVTTPYGTAALGGFTFTSAPSISEVMPMVAGKGDTVTIKGVNLNNVTGISFGGTDAAYFKINSAASISVVVGDGSTGDIAVFSPIGDGLVTSTTRAGFLYAGPPVITSFAPVSASIGVAVTITGNNLSGATAVKFGGMPADTFTVISPTQINAVLGAGASGDVSVTTPYGTVARSGFTFIPLPTITDFTPVAADSGQVITINGTNFTGATAVSFGFQSFPATSFTVISPTQIKAVLGKSRSGYVYVTTAYGTAVKTGFIYTTAPVISSLSPGSGTAGATITINGGNFTGATAVSIGGLPAQSFTVTSVSSITATVGAVSSGMCPVSVTTPAGTTTFSGFYTGPRISSFAPAGGNVGTSVTINGSNFSPVAANNIVYFGATRAVVLSATTNTLTTIVPSGATYAPVSVTINGHTAYSSKLFNITFTGTDTAITAASFAAKVDYTAGYDPTSATIGDVNGDGRPDLVVTHRYPGGYVSIYRNTSLNGALGFAPKVDFNAGTNTLNGTIADFDGDGKYDLLAANSLSLNHTVLRNTSSGNTISFAAAQSVSPVYTGVQAIHMAVGDFDNDGRPDIAAENYNPNTISIYKNTSVKGAISFAEAVGFGIAGNNGDLAAGDLDGDGVTDVAVGNSGTNIVSILRSKGVPGIIDFNVKVDFTVDNAVGDLAITDLDGDGKPELVVTNGNQLSVFRNKSIPGKISFAAKVNIDAGRSITTVAIGDFDGDGKPDMASANGAITVFRNKCTPGTIAFAAKVDYGVWINRLTAGDLDGDGKPDIAGVLANGNYSTVTVVRNASKKDGEPVIASFTPTKAVGGTTVTIKGTNFTGATAVGFGDTLATSFTVVSDTVITAVVGVGVTGNVFVTTPKGTAIRSGFVSPPRIITFTPAAARMGETVTITGTGLGTASVKFSGVWASSVTRVSASTLKAIVGDGQSGKVYVSSADGVDSLDGFTFIPPPPVINSFTPVTASMGAAVTITGKYFINVTAVSFGGVPADSFSVISENRILAIVGAGASGDVRISSATGTGSLSGFTCLPAPPVVHSFTPASGNIGTTVTINGTGFRQVPDSNIVYFGAVRANVIAATSTSLTVKVPIGTTYEPISVYANGFTGYSARPFNVTFQDGGDITVASFAPRQVFAAGNAPVNIFLSDIDGDLNTDINVSVGYPGSQLAMLRNTGTGDSVAFAPKVDYPFSSYVRNAALVDLDGDGDRDVIVVNGSDTYALSFLRNNTVNGNISFAKLALTPITALDAQTITAGDLDLDGKIDAVVSAPNVSMVYFFRNLSANGSIAVSTSINLPTVSPAHSTAIGDLDGDGKPDLVIANYNTSKISVYRNTSLRGSLSLAARVDYTVGGLLEKIAIADLDGDGKAELVVTNGRKTISVCQNTSTRGNISFGTPVDFPVGDFAGYIAFGDLNGDGKPDVAVPSNRDSSVTVLQNTSVAGNISFAAGIAVPAGINPTSISIADINSDGKPDIEVINVTAGTVSVLVNQINRVMLPVISGFTPDSAANGATVTIKGKNFTGATAVTFGGVSADSFAVVSDTTITAVVGVGSSGAVSVVTPYGAAKLGGFTLIISSPVIASFTPASGSEGAQVTITGSGFVGVSAVSFGGVPASLFEIVSPTTITAWVASGATGSVSVTTLRGTATLGGFTFIPPPPAITSFTPASAGGGALISIIGKRFSGATAVSFGGIAATSFTIVADTLITAKIGAGASGSVQVTTPLGQAELSGFTFLRPPAITSLQPSYGKLGTSVTIYGTNFTGATAVFIAGRLVTSFQVISAAEIRAIVGADHYYSDVVSVLTPAGTTAVHGFVFVEAPQINSFTPAAAAQGTTVIITGSNFTQGPDFSVVNAVNFGDVPAASFEVVSPDTITAVVGDGASGSISVQSFGGSAISNDAFTFVLPALPSVITSFTPSSAVTGATVTIRGRGFSGASAVRFGNVPAGSFTVVSDSVITAVVGSGATGTISVTTASVTLSLAGFTYIPPVTPVPVITGFLPASGGSGTLVTINGRNFTGVNTVSFGATPAASFTMVSDSVITAVLGHGATGAVKVTTPQGDASLNGFTFILPPPPPAITGFTPASAVTGATVTIRGRGFSGASAVRFGNVPAGSFTVVSDSVITAVVGSGATGTISVTTASVTLSLAGFTYIPPVTPVPVITGFLPASGDSGTVVTINGRDFTDIIAVAFGGTPAASFIIVSDSVITATVGSGATGAVMVATSDVTSELGGFTYVNIGPAFKLAIYPNPATGTVWVEHPVSANTAQLQIIDMMGNMIKTLKVNMGAPKTQVNLNGIPTGYYRIVWSDEDGITSKGIMIVQ